MPYISRELLRMSLASLNQDYSPLVVVSLPCMLAKKIPTAKSATEATKIAIPFGSPDERKWLNEYFKESGGPRGKPYFMPGTGGWVEERYPDRALQRRRKDFEANVFFHPSEPKWALRPEAAAVLKEKVLKKKPPVPLVALMAWMWRHRAIDSLAASLKKFVAQYGFDREGLLDDVYSVDIPPSFKDAGLASEALSAETVADLLGATAPPPAPLDLDPTVSSLEDSLQKRHFIFPQGLVRRIVGGWLVGDIVVLVGPPGSGKTRLARFLGDGLNEVLGGQFSSAFLEIGPDYDLSQFLGYENLSGEFVAGRFAREVLLVGEPTDPRLVVLDEWNLAQIDAYFAPVLSMIETGHPSKLPGRVDLSEPEAAEALVRAQPGISEHEWVLPLDTHFLATCNSWADEPETRLPISGPVKRRCRIIAMPNILQLRYQEKKDAGISEVCDELLSQETDAIGERLATGQPSVWDKHRQSCLKSNSSLASMDETVRNTLLRVSRELLQNPHTSTTFTAGILRDVLLSCVYAGAGALEALGQQIADKVLHQVQGEPKILESIIQLTKVLPNADEIDRLARRMGAFSGDRRIRPLV